MIQIQTVKTKIGELLLGSFEDRLCLLDYKYRKMRSAVDNRIQRAFGCGYVEESNDLLKEAEQQIEQYLHGHRKEFSIPYLFAGTDFQKSVWTALAKIPYGKTVSYLELSRSIDNEKAVRAVAAANGANSMSIIIPCHRIIGSSGELVGYAGGLDVKKRLLILEGSFHNQQSLDLV